MTEGSGLFIVVRYVDSYVAGEGDGSGGAVGGDVGEGEADVTATLLERMMVRGCSLYQCIDRETEVTEESGLLIVARCGNGEVFG